MEPEIPDAQRWAIFIEQADHRLESQLGQIDALDTKIINLFGFASAVVVVVFAFLALPGQPQTLPAFSLALLFGVLAVYIVAAIFAVWAVRVQNWKGGPQLEDLWDRINEESINSYSHVVAYGLLEAVKKNAPCVERKARVAMWLPWVLLIEVIVVIAVSGTAIISPF